MATTNEEIINNAKKFAKELKNKMKAGTVSKDDKNALKTHKDALSKIKKNDEDARCVYASLKDLKRILDESSKRLTKRRQLWDARVQLIYRQIDKLETLIRGNKKQVPASAISLVARIFRDLSIKTGIGKSRFAVVFNEFKSYAEDSLKYINGTIQKKTSRKQLKNSIITFCQTRIKVLDGFIFDDDNPIDNFRNLRRRAVDPDDVCMTVVFALYGLNGAKDYKDEYGIKWKSDNHRAEVAELLQKLNKYKIQ